ncbi:SRPBCC family protein [Phycisphaera mikurensis]|uniref:Coenzyme Q-binding protein COQ10 START domain-containing protein n=1 Tax=Phycisphaera mikurensis (strain NBRC 102666 / KCTC 22515 / FYK2301M01) TaxID=1142394 RepID=I0IEP8_PHYMF|nr:SRPBCC family protein [Phycisphaera mikurensis]MBB6441533.1 hypothetical protein [Phycisphaera mikurensis]BAM03736.1 hypothetical protein PSMK_15770 [Phycisphaera mikurensis NBRC 102666]
MAPPRLEARAAGLASGLLLLAAILSVGCQGIAKPAAGGAAPASSPLPEATWPAPPRVAERGAASVVIEHSFAVPLVELRRFLRGGERIAAAVEASERMPARTGAEAVAGVWPEAGAVRRVTFADGGHAWERVLPSDSPHRFRWQTWGHTGPAGVHVAYAVGEHAWSTPGEGVSRLVWTHTLHPNHPLKRFLVQRFADRDLAPRLEAALERVAAAAEEASARGS